MKSAPPFRGPAMPTGRGSPGKSTAFHSVTKAATGRDHAIEKGGSDAPGKATRRMDAQGGSGCMAFKGYGATAGK